jgi:hypothetical protein
VPYTEETLKHLGDEYENVTRGLQTLVKTFLTEISPNLKNPRAKEYLEHGVCRRLRVLERSVERIYEIFPPDRKEKLTRDELSDVEIYLHAFVINLFGILDNLAWVYVLEHNLEKEVGGHMGVGLYAKGTQDILPPDLKAHVNLESSTEWYGKYVKNYRDALAHRIPLYVPPLILTDTEATRWKELDGRIWECIQNREFEALENLKIEKEALGIVCDMFTHSMSESESKMLYIHSQVLADGATIVELGGVYRSNFWEHA